MTTEDLVINSYISLEFIKMHIKYKGFDPTFHHVSVLDKNLNLLQIDFHFVIAQETATMLFKRIWC